MKKILLLWLCSFWVGCTTPTEVEDTNSSIQTFSLKAKEGATLVGANGTLLYIPKNAFLCDGKVVENEDINLELIEAFNGNSLIENKLSTLTKDGQLLETVGMIYINASTANCKSLTFNPANPAIARIPSNTLLADVQVFDGKLTETGTVVWENPRAVEKELTLVPLESLDFYARRLAKVPSNVPMQGYNDLPIQKKFIQDVTDSTPVEGNPLYCGLYDEVVKVLYDKKFEKTLISTIEFEERMKFIHKSCSNELIQLYINNLNKNLWEIDEMAASFLKEKNNPQSKTFEAFARLKLTKVKDFSPISVEEIKKAVAQATAKQKEMQDYEEALTISYNVQLTTMGWINCDRFLSQLNTILASLQVKIQNITADAKTDVYLIFSSINSVLPLMPNKEGIYCLGYSCAGMQVPANEKVLLVASSISNKKPNAANQAIILGKDTEISLTMTPQTLSAYKELIHKYFKPKEQDKVVATDSNCCVYDHRTNSGDYGS